MVLQAESKDSALVRLAFRVPCDPASVSREQGSEISWQVSATLAALNARNLEVNVLPGVGLEYRFELTRFEAPNKEQAA